MYSLYKGGSWGPPLEKFEKSSMQEKPSNTFLRLILYIFIFHYSVFFIFFCYSLKFSGYSLYSKPSLFSNQYFFAYYSRISIKKWSLFSNQ